MTDPEPTPPHEGNFNLTNLQMMAIGAKVDAQFKDAKAAGDPIASDKPWQFRDEANFAIKGTSEPGEASLNRKGQIDKLTIEYAQQLAKSGPVPKDVSDEIRLEYPKALSAPSPEKSAPPQRLH